MRMTISALIACGLAIPTSASAFCGFYVAGSGEGLSNNATMVVMMREGTRTVLSMQNDYEGPPNDFAMIVPVPVVLDEENVRTLPREVFANIDRMASPRLVEYWEQDPCAPAVDMGASRRFTRRTRAPRASEGSRPEELGVTVEAEFAVGEYDIVILSANDSDGLETWLQRENYNIPDGASAVLRPYIEQGTKFFVAKVDVERVTFEDGRVVLSPLRFHYDTDTFTLPVRLGLLNSPGTQDLIVHILARNQRYETANYENVTIPTNLDVNDNVRERFAEFYATLFDATLAQNPGAVVTEYAWQAIGCDPCPGPMLQPQDLMTLGADVAIPAAQRGGIGGFGGSPFVLTRLHYRYDSDGLDEDLVFRAAPPIVGGREFLRQEISPSDPPVLNGETLEHGSRPDSNNNFQGRYAIRHPWEGAIECDNPVRGRWGRAAGRKDGDQRSAHRRDQRGAEHRVRPARRASSSRRTCAPTRPRSSSRRACRRSPSSSKERPKHKESPLSRALPPTPEATDTPAAESDGGCGACAVGNAVDPARGVGTHGRGVRGDRVSKEDSTMMKTPVQGSVLLLALSHGDPLERLGVLWVLRRGERRGAEQQRRRWW